MLVSRAHIHVRDKERGGWDHHVFMIEGGETIDCVRQRALNLAYRCGLADARFDGADILAAYHFRHDARPE